MFGEAIAASLVASGLAKTLSLSGSQVYKRIDNLISGSEAEALTEEFVSVLDDSLPSEMGLSTEELENLIDPVNEIGVNTVYQERSEIAKQIAFQLSRSKYINNRVLDEEDVMEIVEEALDRAVKKWFDQIKGTETASRFLLEITWETESQNQAIQEKLDTLVDDQRHTEWYTQIDIDSVDEARNKVSRELGSSRPTTSEIYVDRPEIPEDLTSNKYLVVGRRGIGKTRTLERLQARFLRERDINHVIVPKEGFIGQEDAREFSNEGIKGDVLLVWDDIHGMRAGEQGATVRETILRLSEILADSGNSLHVLASVRSEFKENMNFLNRPTDRVWGDFDTLELEPLDRERVTELTEQVFEAEGLEVEERVRDEIAFEIWYSDPSPLYVESVISALDHSENLTDQVNDLPQDVSGIWEQQYKILTSNHSETRLLLIGIDLLRMGGIPIYEPTLRKVFTEVFERDRFDFDAKVDTLLKKQWIWETENPGPVVDETVYDIRGAQLSAVDGDQLDVVERFSDFLLESLSETVPEGVRDWIPHYHSNIAMFFAHNLIGDTHSLAEPHLERADKLAPFSPTIQNNYANFLLMDGRPEEALDHFEKALTAAPDWAALRNTYATTLDEMGRLYDAIENYKRAIKSEQPQPQAHYNLGVLYVDIGEYQQAKEQIKKALHNGYHVEDAYYNLGILHWSSGDYLQGQKYLEQGLDIFSESRDIRLSLASLLWELEYPKQAQNVLQPLIKAESECSDARLHGILAMNILT